MTMTEEDIAADKDAARILEEAQMLLANTGKYTVFEGKIVYFMLSRAINHLKERSIWGNLG